MIITTKNQWGTTDSHFIPETMHIPEEDLKRVCHNRDTFWKFLSERYFLSTLMVIAIFCGATYGLIGNAKGAVALAVIGFSILGIALATALAIAYRTTFLGMLDRRLRQRIVAPDTKAVDFSRSNFERFSLGELINGCLILGVYLDHHLRCSNGSPMLSDLGVTIRSLVTTFLSDNAELDAQIYAGSQVHDRSKTLQQSLDAAKEQAKTRAEETALKIAELYFDNRDYEQITLSEKLAVVTSSTHILAS